MEVAAQHRSVTATEATPLPAERRPTPGPIAILPDETALFAAAVRSGGGDIEPLSERTRGIVWHGSDTDALAAALAEHPGIGWVQLPSAGVDRFAPLFATQGEAALPLWTSAKGAFSQPVAEHALALTLALLRVLPKRVRAASWSTVDEGISLYGRSVLLIGAGGIAIETIRLLEPFGTDVTVVRRRPQPVAGASRVVTSDELLNVLPDADVVIVAAAFTEGTSKLFGSDEFAAMKPTAVFVNIARGGLVDTDALTNALADGTIGGAGIDVTDPEPLPDGHPLWDEPNVIITPHSADTPEMTEPLLAERIRANVAAMHGDGRFVGVVDPTVGY